MHTAFKELLHQYKVEVFRTEHNQKNTDQIAKECMHLTEEVLAQKYNFHFHKLPDANRAEIVNMINNYIREAVLPPVVEKLVLRQVVLEKHVRALEGLITQMLDLLSKDPAVLKK